MMLKMLDKKIWFRFYFFCQLNGSGRNLYIYDIYNDISFGRSALKEGVLVFMNLYCLWYKTKNQISYFSHYWAMFIRWAMLPMGLILFMLVHSSCMKIMFLLNSSLLSHDRHVVYYVINFPFCAPIV